jgi:hypothetical protein
MRHGSHSRWLNRHLWIAACLSNHLILMKRARSRSYRTIQWRLSDVCQLGDSFLACRHRTIERNKIRSTSVTSTCQIVSAMPNVVPLSWYSAQKISLVRCPSRQSVTRRFYDSRGLVFYDHDRSLFQTTHVRGVPSMISSFDDNTTCHWDRIWSRCWADVITGRRLSGSIRRRCFGRSNEQQSKLRLRQFRARQRAPEDKRVRYSRRCSSLIWVVYCTLHGKVNSNWMQLIFQQLEREKLVYTTW